MTQTIQILIVFFAVTLGLTAFFVSVIKFVIRDFARERKDLYSRIQAGTLQDYANVELDKADKQESKENEPTPHDFESEYNTDTEDELPLSVANIEQAKSNYFTNVMSN